MLFALFHFLTVKENVKGHQESSKVYVAYLASVVDNGETTGGPYSAVEFKIKG